MGLCLKVFQIQISMIIQSLLFEFYGVVCSSSKIIFSITYHHLLRCTSFYTYSYILLTPFDRENWTCEQTFRCTTTWRSLGEATRRCRTHSSTLPSSRSIPYETTLVKDYASTKPVAAAAQWLIKERPSQLAPQIKDPLRNYDRAIRIKRISTSVLTDISLLGTETEEQTSDRLSY